MSFLMGTKRLQIDSKKKDLRMNVIEPCVKEINIYTDLNIKYELLKKGRKFESINFSISFKDIMDRLKL